ncbi:MAG: hypothetical protein ACK5XN_28420, partial [Bacteroidota bacterium]
MHSGARQTFARLKAVIACGETTDRVAGIVSSRIGTTDTELRLLQTDDDSRLDANTTTLRTDKGLHRISALPVVRERTSQRVVDD